MVNFARVHGERMNLHWCTSQQGSDVKSVQIIVRVQTVLQRLGYMCAAGGVLGDLDSCVSVRDTLTVVGGLGRAFLCLALLNCYLGKFASSCPIQIIAIVSSLQ